MKVILCWGSDGSGLFYHQLKDGDELKLEFEVDGQTTVVSLTPTGDLDHPAEALTVKINDGTHVLKLTCTHLDDHPTSKFAVQGSVVKAVEVAADKAVLVVFDN